MAAWTGLMVGLVLLIVANQPALQTNIFFAAGSIFLIASFITPLMGTVMTYRAERNNHGRIFDNSFAVRE